MRRILIAVAGIAGFVVVGVGAMFVFDACPPEGPWPQPPWCDVYDYDRPGGVAAVLDEPVFLANIQQRDIPAPSVELFERLAFTGLGWQGLAIDNVGYRLGSRQLISTAHQAGMPVLCSMNIHYLIRTSELGRPETALIDIDGQPLPVSLITPGYDADGDLLRNILHPDYQAMLLDDIRTNLELGCEGIVFDDDGTGEPGRQLGAGGASFDEITQAGLREHLARRYDTAALADRFGIADVASFDLAEHLRREGIVDTWTQEGGAGAPLAHEYTVFRSEAGRAAIQDVLAEARDWARDELGRDVVFGFNASPLFADKWVVPGHEPADVLVGEHFWFDQYHVKGSVVAKLAENVSPRQFVMLLEVKHDQGELPQRSGNLFAHAFADLYSTGNASMLIFYPGYLTMREWTYVDKVEYDDDAISQHAGFLRDHPDLFGLDEPARVALVHSMPSRRLEHLPIPAERHGGGAPDRQTLALVDLLLSLNVPFHMAATGTDADESPLLEASSLAAYDVVVVPNALAMADADVSALIAYAEGGGTVAQINGFATLDEQGEPVDRPRLGGFADVAGTHQIGRGTWITEDWGSFDEGYLWDGVARHLFAREQDPQHPIRIRMDELLSDLVAPMVVTDAPMTIDVRRFVDGPRTVVHLVNYDFDQVADAFTPAGGFEVAVRPSDGVTPVGARAYDVYDGTVSELEVSLRDGMVVFRVPDFASYLIVEMH